jgi:hypothetical protein
MFSRKSQGSLHTTKLGHIADEVISHYKYNPLGDEWEPWIHRLMLSPRAHYDRACRRGGGFIVCKSCKSAMMKRNIPKYAIVNQCAMGSPPTCLSDLI